MKEYISKLINSNIFEINLSESSVFTLYQFLKNKEVSTYQICSLLKNTEFEAEYKNVHKKIKNFHDSNLIKITKKVREHGAIYYSLTSTGLVYLLSQLEKSRTHLLINLIDNYGDDYFFDLFIYPYINKKTLTSINDEEICIKIIKYFSECSKYLIDKTNLLNTIKNKGYQEISFSIRESSPDRHEWIFKWISNLPWIFFARYEIFRFEEFHDMKTEKISDTELRLFNDKLEFIFTLIDVAKKSIKKLKIYDKKNDREFEQYVTLYYNGFDVSISKKITFEEALKIESEFNHDEIVQNLIYSITKLVGRYGYDFTKPFSAEPTWLMNDLYLFKNDKKFMKILKKVKDGFDKNYSEFFK